MKELFDEVSFDTSKLVTKKYSTSFSLAVKMLSTNIRSAIYNIYGFVRFADEIVDTFHDYKKEELLDDFENEYYKALENGISLNPILNSFQATVKRYNITDDLVKAFLKSMRADLSKSEYQTKEEYNEYIYGSNLVINADDDGSVKFINPNEDDVRDWLESVDWFGDNIISDIEDIIK